MPAACFDCARAALIVNPWREGHYACLIDRLSHVAGIYPCPLLVSMVFQ